MKIANNNENQEEEYKAFLKNIRAEKEESSNFTKLLFTVVLAVLCAVIVCVTVVENSYILDKISTEQADNASGFFKFYKKEKKNFETPFSPRRQNILLLGVDSNGEGSDIWEGTRSDTIIIVNIDPKTHSINAISIPRDSKVYLPDNKGVQKINSAHALGGINLVKKTLKETFGIKIDKYIIVHDEAVEKVVDALGGIPIYVEKPMKYHD